MAKLGGLTISELLEDFLSHRGNELRPVTVKHHREMFAKDVAKPIGSRLVSDVTAAEIVLLLREVKKRSHSVAKRVWENLSVLFAHGVAISACARSPLADLRPVAVLGKAPQRKRRIQLTVQQLMSLCAELPALGDVNRLAILIVLATCVRKSELLQAQWKEFDLENGSWIVPADREGNKAGRSYVVPLAPIVVRWLQELQMITVESEYVLPPQASNSRSKLRHMGRDTLNVALNRLPSTVPRFSPHDLRSTARSYLRDLGTRDDVIARALNHSLGGLEEIYQAGDLFLERQQALNCWAQLLNDAHLGTAHESEVLPLVLRRPRHVPMVGVATVQ